MQSNVIFLNSKYGETKRTRGLNSILENQLNKARIKFDKIYSIESRVDDLIGYKKKNYESKIGWSILGLSILFIYYMESLFSTYDSFLVILLIFIGEYIILNLPKVFHKIIRDLKLSKASSTLSVDKVNMLKSLIAEREQIKKGIKENKILHSKYIERYVSEEVYRENFFYFMSKHLHLSNESTLNCSAEHASKQIKKINFGFKAEI